MEYQKNIPLLATKLFIPSIRANLVDRPKLLQKLDDAAKCKLILVTAPAGYGKTTLVAAWVASKDHPAAWVSLDQSENDPLLFIAYLVGALQNIDSGMCQTADALIQSSEPPATEIIFTYLLNDLACLDTQSLLVIDDYHVIQEPEVHTAMAFLIENAPDNLQIVIASRQSPDLPLSKLRARGQLADLNVFDLRFNSSESVSFVNGVMGLDLAIDQIQELESRTEGWVTGLQLAALSLHGQSGIGDFAYALTGDDKLIANFLIDEVLSQQTAQIQQFLIQASILKQFSTSLCNDVLGITNARDLLDQLEEANLFLIPLDNRGEWYRYHHLFGEMLRRRLEEQQPDLAPGLFHRAMQWHAEQGRTEDAINYAIEGKHFEEATHLISSIALQLQGSGKRRFLIRWIEHIPASLVNTHRLWVHHALAQFYYSNFNQSRHFIETIVTDESIASIEDESQRTLSLSYRDILLGTIELHTTMNAPSVRQSLHAAVAPLARSEILGYGIGWGHFGSASLMMGHLSDAQEGLDKALNTIQKKALSVRPVFAAYHAETIASAGTLQQAARTYQREYQSAYANNTQEGDAFSNVLFGLGNLHYEWNELTQADDLITRSVRIASKSRSIDRILHCYQILLRLRIAQGDFDDIERSIDYAEQVATEYDNPPLVMARINAISARLALAKGQMLAAGRWRQTFERENQGRESTPLQEYEWLTVARIYLAENNISEALRVIKTVHDFAMRQGRVRQVVEISIFMVRAYAEAGDWEQALETLHQTLKLAVLEGYIRSFIDEGQVMQTCLEKISTQNIYPISADIEEYIDVILMEFTAEEARQQGTPLNKSAQPAYESLTPRELDALKLLAGGLTYTEIAAELVISENTLKFHLKNVYSKLDVRNRTEAVLKAQKLSLV